MAMNRYIARQPKRRMHVKQYSLILAAFLFVLSAFGVETTWPHEGTQPPQNHEGGMENHDPGAPGSSKGSVHMGETVYKHMCAFCHGLDGNGGGKAMAYLYPWARDFRKGIFKYRTTPSGSLPRDVDIFRTISRGIPGTAMPAWGSSLTEEETWAVVKYIKTFSKRFAQEEPKSPITVGSPPPTTAEAIDQGAGIFAEMRCGRCHGNNLKGGGPQAEKLFDIWDHRAFVYDLTDPNTYKWGFEKKDIYLILSAGVDGTPMNAYNHLTDEERWDLAAFVESKINKAAYKSAEYESNLPIKKTDGKITVDPEDLIWKNVPSKQVHLIPLSARPNPINSIKFQALINEDAIAFRLEWEDKTPNRSSSRHQDFKDAVAMEFALGKAVLHTHGHNEPFFGMGNRGKVVNIWQWRADWQQDIETKKKLEYATKGMDLDTMIFGGEVNPVESLNPFRTVPVEEMNAEGFGTLTPQPRTKQNILGKGVWKDGKWQVVFSRSLDSLNRWDIKFDNDLPILVSFAVWDGTHQDRNGRKVIAMWQRLQLP